MSINPNLNRTAEKAVLFYNSRNKYNLRGAECDLPMCEEGKCICLDTMQAALLKPVLYSGSEEEVTHLQLRVGQRGNFFSFAEDDISKTNVCQNCKVVRFPHKLFDYGRSQEEHYLKELKEIASHNTPDNKGFNLLQNLSVFYLVNSTEELQQRDSELYLAVYGVDMGFLMSSLFVGIMDAVIERVVRMESTDEVKEAIELLSERLQSMSARRIQDLDHIVDIIDGFSSAIRRVDPTIDSYVLESIRDYRKEMGCLLKKELGEGLSDKEFRAVEQWENKDNEVWRRVLPIYALTKAVCEAAGLNIKWPENLWLEGLLQKETELVDDDVSFLIEKLHSISGAEYKDERNEILKKIGTALKSYSACNHCFISDDVNRLRECVVSD